jgi:hemerythrin superfamily protein
MPSGGVVGMLKADHRKVERLFEEFEKATDRRTKTRIVQQALKELDVHTALEEEIIYPAIRAKIDDEDIMDEALEEHHVAHVLMEELKGMQPSDDRYDAKFTVLAESVKHHVKEEESQVLPKAEEMEVDSPELQDQVRGARGGVRPCAPGRELETVGPPVQSVAARHNQGIPQEY